MNFETSKLIALTSLGAGGVRLTLKEVPLRLHNKIINLFGDYQECFDASQDVNHELYRDAEEAYQELLGCDDVEPFEIVTEENE